MEKKQTLPETIGRLAAAPPWVELARTLADRSVATASGLWGSSVAVAIATLRQQLKRPILLLCGHLDEADDMADDIELFLGVRPNILPAVELAGSLGRMSEEQVSNRLRMIARFASGDFSPGLLVTPIQALMQSVPSPNQFGQLMRTIKPGLTLEPEKLIAWLSDHGYNRLEQVEVPGDFAVRGGIIDVYLPGSYDNADGTEGVTVGLPVRIDFFDDQVESVRRFAIDSLGSQEKLESVQLIDLKGAMPDASESVSLFRYLPPETIVVLWAPLEIAEQAKSYLDRLPEVKGVYPLSAVLKLAEPFARLEMSQFDQGTTSMPSFVSGKEVPRVKLPILSLQKFETEPKKAIVELAEMSATHDVVVYCENEGEQKRFAELLEQSHAGLSSKIDTPLGYLHRGFVFAPSPQRGEGWGEGRDVPTPVGSRKSKSAQRESQSDERRSSNDVSPLTPALSPPGRGSEDRPIAVLGHHELFHRYEQRRRVGKQIATRAVDSFLDLKVGDYVVHVAHGIAKFTGMQTLNKDGHNEEYLTLRFAENATLHVPASRINLIQKYIGGFTGHPQLSRLGSGSWEKQKAKVAEAVMDMASELIEVQAARAAEVGTSFPPDTEWQREFEEEFRYEPTEDQVTGATEIKGDMEKRKPMDRLLCGDVGYGKTELAMRAAFKAIEYGKQVAVLVPTTVLAEQHYRSFSDRMSSYPFKVDSISRFRTTKEQKDTLKQLAAGEIDILIGTHRLISKDVKFKDLGLVVIDEEQRFGVTHKERLKQMRKTVDVLTMSATPIPRTLHMSMLGLRDISSLTTAPQDRRSIVTEVMAFDKERVKLAILRELQREGQVYFVHNRVHNIIEMADDIQKLVPDAKILIGHGQMGDGEMEEAMLKFIRHEADILVCTTIIESGLDIPNANTMIINAADRFGLSELHQLRGRVGRSKNRAYCYLLLPPDRPITPVASKRLKAIEEYSHLGAGFKIAMRDLEIRGAGNILGPEQSGHISTVGYEMYCQLLEEATRQLKNEPKAARPEAHVDIGLSAFIPKTYIAADKQRMEMYRRLTRCASIEMLTGLENDMRDAFGEPPRQVVVLLALTEVRLLSQMYGIESVIKKDPDVILTVIDAARAQKVLFGAPGTLRVVDEKTVYLRMPASFMEPETMLIVLKNLMRKAHDRELKGEAPPDPSEAKAKLVAATKIKASASEKAATAKEKEAAHAPLASKPVPPRSIPAAAGASSVRSSDRKQGGASIVTPEMEKLLSLRDQGILTDAEFSAAMNRLAKR